MTPRILAREAARRLGMSGSEHTLSVDDIGNVVVMLTEARSGAEGPDGSSVPIMTRLFVALAPEFSHLLFDCAEGVLGRDEARGDLRDQDQARCQAAEGRLWPAREVVAIDLIGS